MKRQNPLDALCETKLAKIASLEKAIAKLRIEVSALQQARAMLAEEAGLLAPPTLKNGTGEHKRRGRSISNAWKAVLASIATAGPRGASLDQVARFAEAAGISLKRPTLRAQMSNYVKAGYLTRGDLGEFLITLEGMNVAREYIVKQEADYIAKHPSSAQAESSGAPAQTGAPVEGR